MPDHSAPAPDAPRARTGLFSRALGVLTSPRDTYAGVVNDPHAFGVLALVFVVTSGATAVFFSTEVGRLALLDQQVRTMESFGRQISAEQYQRMEQILGYASYFAVGSQIVRLLITTLGVSGIVVAIFNALLGGNASFRQTFAVVAHTTVLFALQQLFVLPLDYARETISSPTNLAVFLPFLDEGTFLARLLGSIDLFQIWWLVTLSIGLGVLYRRRTAPIAWSLLAVYVVIGVAIAAAKSVLSGA